MDGIKLILKASSYESTHCNDFKLKNLPLYALKLAIDHLHTQSEHGIKWAEEGEKYEGEKVSFKILNNEKSKKILSNCYGEYRLKCGYNTSTTRWSNMTRAILHYGKFIYTPNTIYVIIPNFFMNSTKVDLYLLKSKSHARRVMKMGGVTPGRLNPKYKSFN